MSQTRTRKSLPSPLARLLWLPVRLILGVLHMRRHSLAFFTGAFVLLGSACFTFNDQRGPACTSPACTGCCDTTGACVPCGTVGDGGGVGGAGGGAIVDTDGGLFCQPIAGGIGGGSGGGGGSPTATSYAPAPITGGSVVVVDDTLAAVMDADRERVWMVGLPNGPATSVSFPAGSRPDRAVVDAQGIVHVVLRGTAQVAHIDPRAHTLLGTDALGCPEPRGIDVHQATQDLVVACRGGEVVRFQPGGPQTVTRLGEDLRDVLLDGDSMTVSTFRAASLTRYPQTTGGAPQTFAPTSQTTGTPEVAWRTVRAGEGQLVAYQEAATSNIVTGSGLCPAGTVPGTSAYGAPSSGIEGADACSALAMKSAITWDVGDGTLVAGLVGDVLPVDVAAQRVDPACAPPAACSRSINVAVAGAGGTASLYQLTPGDRTGSCLVPRMRLAGNFTGAAFLPSGRAVLHDRRASSLILVDPNTASTVGVYRYATDSVDSEGSRLFHRVPEGGVAITCASCHPEGGEDGHTWLLDGELRRTQSLQGGVMSRAPFHWKGTLPSLGALMDDTFVQRMGASAPEPATVGSLAAWLDTVPAVKPSPPAQADQLTRGHEAFVKANCESCHSGPQLSNHLAVPVGTGGVFKTPSLVGLSARGPWMHDGCAKTLRLRFTDPACGGTSHGSPELLSATELDDLVAYLESL